MTKDTLTSYHSISVYLPQFRRDSSRWLHHQRHDFIRQGEVKRRANDLIGLVSAQWLCDCDVVTFAFSVSTNDTIAPSRSPSGSTWVTILASEVVIVAISSQCLLIVDRRGTYMVGIWFAKVLSTV